MFKSQEEIIERLMARMPFPGQIKELDFENQEVRFTWMCTRFSVACNGSVSTVHGNMLHGDNEAILLKQLLTIKQF